MGLFRVKLFPVDKSFKPLVLCDSPDIPTTGISLNHRPVFEVATFQSAAYAKLLYHGNRRNTLSFSITRNCDPVTQAAFISPGVALVSAVNFTLVLPGLSVAEIRIVDANAQALFYLENCGAERSELSNAKGTSQGWAFTLNGGAFLTKFPTS